MNKKLLQNWISEGLAVTDLGDDTWGWTDLAKRILPPMTRTNLSNLLYNQNLDHKRMRKHALTDIAKHGFNEEGFVLTDE